MGVWFLAVLFKIQHWSGGSILEWLGIVLIVVSAIIAFVKRHNLELKLKKTI